MENLKITLSGDTELIAKGLAILSDDLAIEICDEGVS